MSTPSTACGILPWLLCVSWSSESADARVDNTLDSLFTTEQDGLTQVKLHPPWTPVITSLSLHPYLSWFLSTQTPSTITPWHMSHHRAMNNALLEFYFDYKFSNMSVEATYNTLLEILQAMISLYVPSRVAGDPPIVPWKSKPTTELVRKRHNARAYYKSVTG